MGSVKSGKNGDVLDFCRGNLSSFFLPKIKIKTLGSL